jgi:hypothetical protein
MDRPVEFGGTEGGNGQTRRIDRGRAQEYGKDKTEGDVTAE